jgi:hypothetical protein
MAGHRHYSVPVTEPEATERPRQPLLVVALALLIIVIRSDFHGYDALPDPLAWLLIAVASAAFPQDVPRRSALIASALLAMVASVASWRSSWNDRIVDLDPSLAWAIALPSLVWSALFCLAVAHLAKPQLSAHIMWTYVGYGFVAAIVLPVIVFGGGIDSLEGTYAAIIVLSQVALFVLALMHAWKPWALVPRPHD